jgi:CheY-like chemotaxis protein
MPRKNGFEVLAALAHDPQLKFLPVIVFTSTATPQEINRCYELGASAYLTKPLGLEQFFTSVQTTVEFWSGCKFRTLAN